MAALNNTVTTEQVVTALDKEMLENFKQDFDRLAELFRIAAPEVIPAGTALYQYKIEGALNDAEVAEGDEVPLSRYKVEKTPIGELEVKPYRKLTTAQAVLKTGFVNAVTKTDRKMLQDVRANIISDFFAFLANGTGSASGVNLQGALAYADAVLGDTMEENNDHDEAIFHFVNRQDIAGYLANANIETQSAFGMTYIQNFLGVEHIFVTSKVPQGTVYATPAGNIHMYAADFGALANANLQYATQDGSLIGVHHKAEYARTAAETYVLTGAKLLAEATNYIVKATIAPAA